MKFLRPIDGDVLFSVADGTATENGLLTTVSLCAPAGSNILINGIPAREEAGVFSCQILLDAYFTFDEQGEPTISYYLNKEQAVHAATRDFWVDNQEDIIFVKDDIIINEVALADIDAHMEQITRAEGHAFHYLLIHEQYFYPHYFAYEPDYRERVFAAVDFCHRNGYRPATLTEVALEHRY